MTGPHESHPDLVLLHTLRCVGVAGVERLAAASGSSPSEASRRLDRLAGRGWVELDPGPFGGWSLTDTGRSVGQEMLESELALTAARAHVHRCYQTFLELNPALLQVCSDWQLRAVGGTPYLNDHTDEDYDATVLSRLMRIDRSVHEVCNDLTARLSRFGLYGIRLSDALNRVLAGDVAHLADNTDSYHTVWFQLHEDLLTTLGISRSDERDR